MFVSHTSAHKADVAALKWSLGSRGIDAFVAHDDIEPSHEWQGVIESALATCEAIVPWLTPDFPNSRWTDQEVGFGVGRSVLVVPVRLGLDPYGFIGKYQGLQGVGRTVAQIADEIADIVAASELTAQRYVAAAARAFARAQNFEMARRTWRTLTRLPGNTWTDDLLSLIERAAVENGQVREGVYERERIPDLLVPFVKERRSRTRATA
jgi:hypothetical protein